MLSYISQRVNLSILGRSGHRDPGLKVKIPRSMQSPSPRPLVGRSLYLRDVSLTLRALGLTRLLSKCKPEMQSRVGGGLGVRVGAVGAGALRHLSVRPVANQKRIKKQKNAHAHS